MFDPNHMPKHRADRDTDSPSLALVWAPIHIPSGLVVGAHRRSFLGRAYDLHLRVMADRGNGSWAVRSERGSATAGAALILFAFASFLIGVGAFVKLVTP